MSKIGTDQLPKIMAGFDQLMEDIKKRNLATITGVKIPDLIEGAVIDENDELIVEQQDGTKKIPLKLLLDTIANPREVIEARPSLDGTQNASLKERLDKMEQVGVDNKTDLDTYKPIVDELVAEIETARGVDNQGTPFPKLVDRLDDIDFRIRTAVDGSGNTIQELEQLRLVVERNQQNIQTNQQDIQNLDQTTQGVITRVEALERGGTTTTNDIADIKNRLTAVEVKADANEVRIQNLETTRLKFRVV